MHITQSLKNQFQVVSTLVLLVATACSGSGAEPVAEKSFLHPLFSEHVVLQREKPVPVWGWSQPGSKVTVSFAGQKATATVALDGKWMVKLEETVRVG